MKQNLFEMGSNFDDAWTSDNKAKPKKRETTEIKTPQKHQLHFAKERRRGKTVTIVKPFFLESKELKILLKTLKKKLGTGGTLKENTLEFQGEITKSLQTQLEKLGYGLKH
jgi:translation initiation factor 1